MWSDMSVDFFFVMGSGRHATHFGPSCDLTDIKERNVSISEQIKSSG